MPVSKFPLRFLRRGQWTELDSVNPNTTLLDFIREVEPAGLGCRGTKEGCAQGDCGACAVLIAELAPTSNEIRLRSINACIKPLSSIDGCALWTVEDLQDDQGRLHPVQHALVKAHGSQCGFCTPGFVMSLVALYETRLLGKPDTAKPLTRDAVLEAISGNLCRCTGYAPIVAAGMMLESYLPADGTIGDTLVTSPASDAHSGSHSDLGSGINSGAAHNGLMTAGQTDKLLRALQEPGTGTAASSPHAEDVAQPALETSAGTDRGRCNRRRAVDQQTTSPLRANTRRRRGRPACKRSAPHPGNGPSARRPGLPKYSPRFAGIGHNFRRLLPDLPD